MYPADQPIYELQSQLHTTGVDKLECVEATKTSTSSFILE
jgi:hypothetical protein